MAFVGSALPVTNRTRGEAHICARPCMQGDPADVESSPELTPTPIRRPPQPGPVAKSTATWDDKFHEEFPIKGSGSLIGWDLRPSEFREPENGAGICDLCRGTGQTACSFCQGNDYMGPDGTVKCLACEGKYQVPCPACYTSGKQVDIVRSVGGSCRTVSAQKSYLVSPARSKDEKTLTFYTLPSDSSSSHLILLLYFPGSRLATGLNAVSLP
jgi:hypothetical protein